MWLEWRDLVIACWLSMSDLNLTISGRKIVHHVIYVPTFSRWLVICIWVLRDMNNEDENSWSFGFETNYIRKDNDIICMNAVQWTDVDVSNFSSKCPSCHGRWRSSSSTTLFHKNWTFPRNGCSPIYISPQPWIPLFATLVFLPFSSVAYQPPWYHGGPKEAFLSHKSVCVQKRILALGVGLTRKNKTWLTRFLPRMRYRLRD